MGVTLVGWHESQNTGNVLTLHKVIDDDHVTVTGDDIKVPGWANKLIGVYAVGELITAAQLTSPSLRAKNLLDIEPVDNALEPEEPAAVHIFKDNPIELTPAEALRFSASGSADPSTISGFVWLMDSIEAVPAGEIMTVKATNTDTLSPYAWTSGALTFSQTLRAGRYAIVGMRARSAGLIACRLIIPGVTFRPGCLGVDAVGDTENSVFRRGGLGNLGEFNHDAPPRGEFFSRSADNNQTIFLDLIKIA